MITSHVISRISHIIEKTCTVHLILRHKVHCACLFIHQNAPKTFKKEEFPTEILQKLHDVFWKCITNTGCFTLNGRSCCRAVSILKCKMRHWIRWLSYRSFNPKCFELLKRIFIFKFPKTSSIIFHKLFNLTIGIQRIVNVNFALSYSWNGGNFFTKPT